MSRLAVAGLALLAATGCTNSTLEGRIVDAMNDDAPLEGEKLIAKAVDQVRMTCQQFSGTSDAQGRFAIEGLCLNETAYRLMPADEGLFLAETDEVPAGGLDGPLTLRAWPAPRGDGMYELSGTELTPIPTHTKLKKVGIYQSDEQVWFPETLPEPVPVIEEGEHLVITGPEHLEKLRLEVLKPSGPRKFGDDERWIEMESWWYIGTTFAGDEEFERVEAIPTDTGVTEVSDEDHAARFLAHDALPPGRYALYRDGARRAHIVQFGQLPEPAEGQVAEGDAAGGGE